MTFSWGRATRALQTMLKDDQARSAEEQRLDDGQRASLDWITKRLPKHGLVLADEVGTGKTRIACALVHAVLESGGRAAVVVPHGLMHQWVSESRRLNADIVPPKELTTTRELLRDLSPDQATRSDFSPRPHDPEWWLISHGFRAPVVTSATDWWRIALPSLVEWHLSTPAQRCDGRTRISKLQDSKLQDQITGTSPASLGWKVMTRIASELAPRLRGHNELWTRLKALPLLDLDSVNNEALVEQFGDHGDGRPLTEDLLGLWLGEFDLLIIDEAHKSRGEVAVNPAAERAVSGTVLARLVDALLKQPTHGRRLCLTATPMELELAQWLDLLARARSGLNREQGEKAVNGLHDAATNAAAAPDQMGLIDKLCRASTIFTGTFQEHVTRRRRDEDPLLSRFRACSPPTSVISAHPHRRLERVKIGWTDMVDEGSAWLDVLFAAECMSQSARGLTLKDTATWPRAVRDAYTKLSAGHVSVDLGAGSEPLWVPEPGVVDYGTRSKIARTVYWYEQLRKGHQRVQAGMPQQCRDRRLSDAEHPRILAAVKEIEAWTQRDEKVLVFGVFLGPLRLLRDVLNVRHALRAADVGRPFAHAVHTDNVLLAMASRQLYRLRAEGALTGQLRSADWDETLRSLVKCHEAYKPLREKVRHRAKKAVEVWLKDPSLFGGADVERTQQDALEDHLHSFVLDDFLLKSPTFSDVTDERVRTLTDEFIRERLRPVLGDRGGDDADEDWVEARQASLRALEEDVDGRHSVHARLLQGETEWATRRSLQAAFNRDGASPRILIAQSQVGREGLNLHLSCRVIVQFHAEWNPAVLEQQIGRVDRKGSLWERLANEWLKDPDPQKRPLIEVRQLVFEGTYDAFQWERLTRRKHVFDASLFGALLPAEIWGRIPVDFIGQLTAAAPNFSPFREATKTRTEK